ncbi:patatin-like phospholipase family protein [Phormidium tenue FACHB-886]|nr:patatin-like phospholipase family protein [Phormidium tenue FACHB-886]
MTYKYKILSIDGGGIRGIIPAMMLAEIERRTSQPIAELFDMIAGTSTGGILALGLTKPGDHDFDQPQYSAKDLVELYRQEGQRIFREIFPGKTDECLFNPKHRADCKDAVLTEYLGNTPIAAALKEVFVTSYDTQLRKPIFFTSNRRAEDCDRDLNFRKICSGFTLKQAAMATSAAPTFFEPYQIETAQRDTLCGIYSLVDGAVYANNPTLLALLEAQMSYYRDRQEELHLKEILIVSLGTGSMAQPYPYEQIRGWGKLQWIQPFIQMTFDGQSEAVDSQLSSLLRTSGSADNYYRFQTELNEEFNAMDDVSDTSLHRLMALSKRMIAERETEFDRLCKLLTHQLSPSRFSFPKMRSPYL